SAANREFSAKSSDEELTFSVVIHDEKVARRGSRRVTIKDGKLTGGSEPASLPQTSRAQPASSKAGVSGSGITARDLLAEATAGMLARPMRMSLTVLGIVIGMSALVSTVGLTRTAGNRTIRQFDQLAAR